jgi:hypothetical protein
MPANADSHRAGIPSSHQPSAGRRSFARWLVLLLLGGLPGWSAASADTPTEPAALLEAAAARAGLWRTGSIRYQYGTCRVQPSDPEPWPWDPAEWSPVRPSVTLTLAGDEWVLRHAGGNVVFHREQLDAEYLRTPQPDGAVTHGCRLMPPVSDLPRELDRDFKYRVIHAGGYPSPAVGDYVAARADTARDLGPATLGDELCRVLEWDVPAADYPTLDLWLDDWPACRLRIHYLTDRGGAIRRLEYLGPADESGLRYESRDFFEPAPGVWFPRVHQRIIDQTRIGRGYLVDQYFIEAVTGFNEPIDEAAFDLRLPAGTLVTDLRDSAAGVSFTTGQNSRLTEIEALLRDGLPSTLPPTRAPTTPWLLILNAGLLLLLAAGWAVTRRNRTKDVR